MLLYYRINLLHQRNRLPQSHHNSLVMLTLPISVIPCGDFGNNLYFILMQRLQLLQLLQILLAKWGEQMDKERGDG
jgi:hypothetical protein